MTERLGPPVLYENRGGGGGVVAGEIVARAAPDGYTLLVAAVAVMTVNSTLMKMPFEPAKDPVIQHRHFAGTGTRFVRENGRAAIRGLFALSFA